MGIDAKRLQRVIFLITLPISKTNIPIAVVAVLSCRNVQRCIRIIGYTRVQTKIYLFEHVSIKIIIVI